MPILIWKIWNQKVESWIHMHAWLHKLPIWKRRFEGFVWTVINNIIENRIPILPNTHTSSASSHTSYYPFSLSFIRGNPSPSVLFWRVHVPLPWTYYERVGCTDWTIPSLPSSSDQPWMCWLNKYLNISFTLLGSISFSTSIEYLPQYHFLLLLPFSQHPSLLLCLLNC